MGFDPLKSNFEREETLEMLHLLPQVIIHAQKIISFDRRSFKSLDDGFVVEVNGELVDCFETCWPLLVENEAEQDGSNASATFRSERRDMAGRSIDSMDGCESERVGIIGNDIART